MDKTIKIKGVEYPVRFKFKMLRMLGTKWNCKGWVGVLNTFQKQLFPNGIPEEVSSDEADLSSFDFPFESSAYFLDLINAAIVTAGGKELDMDLEEFEDEVMMDIGTLSFVTSEFMENISKHQQSSGNAEPRTKARMKATQKKPGKKQKS
jgi:hypothetical protein